MKLISLILGLHFLELASAQANLNFCGAEQCIIPVRETCQYMLDYYVFQGSCCQLEDNSFTGGCRIYVGGNCAWSPLCERCDRSDQVQCDTEFRSDENQVCPIETGIDALREQALRQIPITCFPTETPVEPEPTPAPGSSAQSSVDIVASIFSMVLVAIYSGLGL